MSNLNYAYNEKYTKSTFAENSQNNWTYGTTNFQTSF